MKERPILFSTPMVQAILAWNKTQTRRVVKSELIIEQAEFESGNRPHVICSEPSLQYLIENGCPFGQIGDRLWVRETTIISPPKWLTSDDVLDHTDIIKDSNGEHRVVQYIASNPDTDVPVKDYKLKKTPSIHMPRWASRILLEIMNIRIERLNDISEDDAKAEGMIADDDFCAEEYFSMLWNKIHGWNEKGWNANPWVWVVEFKVIQGGKNE